MRRRIGPSRDNDLRAILSQKLNSRALQSGEELMRALYLGRVPRARLHSKVCMDHIQVALTLRSPSGVLLLHNTTFHSQWRIDACTMHGGSFRSSVRATSVSGSPHLAASAQAVADAGQ